MWTDAGQENPTKCIWHTKQDKKPAEELIASLENERGSNEPWERRFDGAYLRGVEFPEQKGYEDIEGKVDFSNCSFVQADLSGTHLNGALLMQTNLTWAELSGIHLREAFLMNARLDGATLEEATLDSANLTGNTSLRAANLTGASLYEAKLWGGNLEATNLEGANLTKTLLIAVNLSRAFLKEADLSEAHLEGADLSEAHLEEADLSEAWFTEADLSEAHLEGADLSGANLEEADLSEVHLEEADLSEAWFTEADLSEAHLEGADLSEATLEHATLEKADLRLANLSNTRWYHAFHPDIRINDETTFGDQSVYEQAAKGNTTKQEVGLEEVAADELWERAAWTYGQLDRLHRENSMPAEARQYHFRKGEATRNYHREASEKFYDHHRRESIIACANRWLTGYGNRFRPLFGCIFGTILLSAVLYLIWGFTNAANVDRGLTDLTTAQGWQIVAESLLLSISVFGFGSTSATPTSWSIVVEIVESLLGAFLFGLVGFVLARRLP